MRNFIFGVFIFAFFTASPFSAIAQEPDKLREALSAMGFRITRVVDVDPTSFEKSEFDLKKKRIYVIRSIRPVPGERNLYYRYTVEIEEYADQVHALHRLERIQAAPPGPTSKMESESEYELREAFKRGNLVYVVGTDVYTFVVDKSLSRLTAKLENAVPDFGDHAYPHVRCGPHKVFKIAARCKSAVDGKKRYFSHLVTFDVVKVLKGEFAGSEITLEAKPNWVRAGTAEGRLVEALGISATEICFGAPRTPLSLRWNESSVTEARSRVPR